MTTIYVSSRKNIIQNESRSSAAANHHDQLLFRQAMDKTQQQNQSKSDLQEKPLTKDPVSDKAKFVKHNEANPVFEKASHNSLFEKLGSQKNALSQREAIISDAHESALDEELKNISEDRVNNDEPLTNFGFISSKENNSFSDSNNGSQSETLQAIESLREGVAYSSDASSSASLSINDFLSMFDQLQKEVVATNNLSVEGKRWAFSLEEEGLPVVSIIVGHEASEGWSIRLSADSEDNKNMLEHYKWGLEERLSTSDNSTQSTITTVEIV